MFSRKTILSHHAAVGTPAGGDHHDHVRRARQIEQALDARLVESLHRAAVITGRAKRKHQILARERRRPGRPEQLARPPDIDMPRHREKTDDPGHESLERRKDVERTVYENQWNLDA